MICEVGAQRLLSSFEKIKKTRLNGYVKIKFNKFYPNFESFLANSDLKFQEVHTI